MGSPEARRHETQITEMDHGDRSLGAEFLALVREILGEPSLELRDNFLDVGGHSLLAIELSDRVDERFGKELSMRRLYEERLQDVVDDMAV